MNTLEAELNANSRSIGAIAIAVLMGSTALMSSTSYASTPSSPAERAATADLNRNISDRNASEQGRYRDLRLQYEEQLKQYELEEREYRTLESNQLNSRPYGAEGNAY